MDNEEDIPYGGTGEYTHVMKLLLKVFGAVGVLLGDHFSKICFTVCALGEAGVTNGTRVNTEWQVSTDVHWLELMLRLTSDPTCVKRRDSW